MPSEPYDEKVYPIHIYDQLKRIADALEKIAKNSDLIEDAIGEAMEHFGIGQHEEDYIEPRESIDRHIDYERYR